MPVIVYKTMNLLVAHLQGYRITCDSCGKHFTYVYRAEENFSTTGVPLLSSDEGMRGAIQQQVMKRMAKVAASGARGMAMCPHCSCYQEGMVRNSFWTNLGCGFAAGLVLLPIAALILNAIFGFTREDGTLFVVSLILGAVVGAVVGKILAKTRGPHLGKADPLAMKDEDLLEILRVCKEKNCDPLLLWYFSATKTEPDPKVPNFSLGLLDESREPIDFEEFSTAQMMKDVL